MEEKELFNYGNKELNVNSLLKYIDSNQQSYLDFYSNSISDSNAFIEKVNYIKEGIKNGNITTDGAGVYTDASGKILENDELMNNALHYVDIIAKELSKKPRALTKTEIAKQEKDKELKKIELERKKSEAPKEEEKPKFEPASGWSVAKAFAHSFNQNGQIPYDLLQQLVTTDESGNAVYENLHKQLGKNFDLISKQLKQYNNTESYINNIDLFKNALKDGDLSPQDKLLGMELGFQSSELDKLSNLIKYKVESVNKEETPIPESVEETKQDSVPKIPELKQDPLESNAVFQMRVNKLKNADEYYTKLMRLINFDQFKPSEKLKNDSEESFKNYLKYYIHTWIINQYDSPILFEKEFWRPNQEDSLNLIKKEYYPAGIGGIGTAVLPLYEITTESLKYLDPKLYNELGLKYFSNYSASKMYKHFKELVDKQNKETVSKQAKGGVVKAQGGVKVPTQLNFDNLDYDSLNELTDFSQYDAKQMAEVLNETPVDWHTFTGEADDGASSKRKAIADFITRLKTPGGIQTGNGLLTYNTTNTKWEYSGWEDKSALSNVSESDTEDESILSNESADLEDKKTTTSGTKKAPKVADLTLKQLKFKKQSDFNSNGTLNSLAGYIVNEIANHEKQEIQKTIPIYQEIPTPEKSFKTAYTYDLEKAKNEIMAEANSIKPITSDASQYYAAKNDAIKNAREYTTKLDTAINDVILKTKDENATIAFDNAVERTNDANTNAKYRHDWEIEQKQGEVDRIEASNQSFQNLNKEIKHDFVTKYRQKKKQRDAYAQKHILKGIMTTPSNYIDGWTKSHDLIWYKGQNNQLENDEERTIFQQLSSVVQQAIQSIMAQYEGIDYEGIGKLHVPQGLMAEYTPKVPTGARGMKINKSRMCNFINKLK